MDELDAVRVIFAPDPSNADTFYGQPRMREPEDNLKLSVLAMAVDDLSNKDKRLRDSARVWIFTDPIDPDWPFTFENICEDLGKDPSYLRKALKTWKTKK